MNLSQRLETILASSNLNYQKVSFLDSKQPLRDVVARIDLLYMGKTHEELVQEIIDTKEQIQKEVFGLDFCPFEKLTSVSWKEMFMSAYYKWKRRDGVIPVKNICPFLHFMLPSHLFKTQAFHRHTVAGKSFLLNLHYVGKSFVRICGTRYIYGEAGIVIDPQGQEVSDIHTRIQVSTIVFDDMIIPILKRQKQFDEVMRSVYVLYHLASHDGWIHSLYMDGVPKICELIDLDPVMSDFRRIGYFCFDMYELNFVRMMREIFSITIDANCDFADEILALHCKVFEITDSWDAVAREYIQFVVEERMRRIMPFISWISYRKKEYFELQPKGHRKKIYPITKHDAEFFYFMTHGCSEEGAIVYGSDSEIQKIPWEQMTRHMLDFHFKVKPVLV